MDTKAKPEVRQQRYFSEQFKKEKVKELVEERLTIKQVCQLYNVSKVAVYKWLYKYSLHNQQQTTLVVQMESEAFKTQQLLQHIAELERAVGQKQLEIDFLSKVLELSSEELGFVKQNLNARLLNGSALTNRQPNTPTP